MSYLRILVTDGMTRPEGLAEISADEAWSLAQLCKRITLSDLKGCAVDDDEAYVMRNAIDKLRSALSETGYDPR